MIDPARSPLIFEQRAYICHWRVQHVYQRECTLVVNKVVGLGRRPFQLKPTANESRDITCDVLVCHVITKRTLVVISAFHYVPPHLSQQRALL